MIESITQGLDFAAFVQSPQALRAVLYSLVVIGEAVASMVVYFEVIDPAMPWKEIQGMRNMIIHEYFRVDTEILWETVQVDLPLLKESLLRIQQELSDVE